MDARGHEDNRNLSKKNYYEKDLREIKSPLTQHLPDAEAQQPDLIVDMTTDFYAVGVQEIEQPAC